ncbi:hypothetical protein Tsubulata_035414 [Turnera subulata]|uniref:Uncharacterized protein n=1 Tax=Turnera subulata TaxID=218843 RepID=A0A9Q0FC20_9ROSI|nr:hypothetical protein Tsubulata_035414 [Turnera subulata]
MSDAYGRVKGGRLIFKGGSVATSSKSIDKKKKKKKKPNPNPNESGADDAGTEAHPGDTEEGGSNPGGDTAGGGGGGGGGEIYTIDAAKRKKYEELFPVEAKKFGYNPKPVFNTVEDALDDRVKKKADRYCK